MVLELVPPEPVEHEEHDREADEQQSGSDQQLEANHLDA